MIVADLKYIGLSYLATPYTKYRDGINQAWIEACKLTASLSKLGAPVFSPIVHGHPLSVHGGIDPLDGNFWIKIDDFYMERCDALLIAKLPGWRDSVGVQYEKDAFEEDGKPVFYIHPVTLAIEPVDAFQKLSTVTNRVLSTLGKNEAAE